MFVFTTFLRKGQCSGENVTAIHLKKKFPLSETSQEFQIQLGDIRKQLKSNLKSPPTFHLLLLPSNHCSWSTYWQIFPKWAIICLKTENFLVKMELFSLKNEFAVTLRKKKKKPKCSDFPRTSLGLKLQLEILLGQLGVDFEAEAPSREGSWTLELPRVDLSVLSLCFPHSLMAPHHRLG